ncbi:MULTISPECIES: LPS assembly lipoprotein LptE [Novosphingopyxis]|uniref:LPS assembly lipoprotein LptE n=1 Tax=Novosphingopyxis TaxID=2709686 RepID=UPI001650FD56|nr:MULTISPECIES: LPS assembly lipoprotein LptE [Novosphingopyxis]MBH9536644.1 hypothetical protein [Novosphingopyxis sp. YJ-S2-01]
MIRLLLLAAAVLMLPSCGLRPLYAGGSNGPVANALGSVAVDPIPGRDGWLVRNALQERLQPLGSGAPRYKLTVKLDDDITGFGVRSDDAVTRERRTLRARFQLTELSSGNIILDATEGTDAGIDVVSSEYAVIAAENTALENLADRLASQIVTRLSVQARPAS